jgi:hypothetical protein
VPVKPHETAFVVLMVIVLAALILWGSAFPGNPATRQAVDANGNRALCQGCP